MENDSWKRFDAFRPATSHGRWMNPDFRPGLVSVIIPTYNRAGLLAESMQSVLDQSHRPIELLIVDDGSTDGTAALAEDWRDRYNGVDLDIRYLRQNRRGAPAARNLGLIESRGEFIQFLDSDDLLHPDKLALQAEMMRDDLSLDFVYAQSARFGDAPDWAAEPYCGCHSPSPLPRCLVELRYFWNTESGIYRRNLCVSTGPWDESLRRSQDWEYNVRMVVRGVKIGHIARTLNLCRVHSQGRIADSDSAREALESRLVVADRLERLMDAAGALTEEALDCLAERYYRLCREAWLLGADDYLRRFAVRGNRLGVRPAMFARINLISLIPRPIRSEFDRYYDPRKDIFQNIKRLIVFHIRPRLRGEPPLK